MAATDAELVRGALEGSESAFRELVLRGQAIHQALIQSRYLIVICSPRAARSVYINKEILEFKRLGRSNRILALVIDGEPNASNPDKRFDPARECFPDGLRHPVVEAGELDLTKTVEPIAADARAETGAEVSLRDKTQVGLLEREKLRLIAGLLGIGFDELIPREKERLLAERRARARRLRKLVVSFAALTLVAGAAGIVATVERAAAERQRR